MIKWKKILIAAAFATMMVMAGCGDKEPDITDKEIFEDELIPLDEDEIKEMEEDFSEDEEMQMVEDGELQELDGSVLDEETEK